KNHYKNQGIPKHRIVSIPLLAQAVTAAVLGKPDFARARPSTLIKRDEDYRSVFDERRPLRTYLEVVRLLRRVDVAISTYADEEFRPVLRNLRFHGVWVCVARRLRKVRYRAAEV